MLSTFTLGLLNLNIGRRCFELFPLFFLENKIWHFLQVSGEDNFLEMPSSFYLEIRLGLGISFKLCGEDNFLEMPSSFYLEIRLGLGISFKLCGGDNFLEMPGLVFKKNERNTQVLSSAKVANSKRRVNLLFFFFGCLKVGLV